MLCFKGKKEEGPALDAREQPSHINISRILRAVPESNVKFGDPFDINEKEFTKDVACEEVRDVRIVFRGSPQGPQDAVGGLTGPHNDRVWGTVANYCVVVVNAEVLEKDNKFKGVL